MNIVHISDIDVSSHAGGMNTVIPELIKRQITFDSSISNILFIAKRKGDISVDSSFFPIYFMEGNYTTLLKKANLFVFHSVYNLNFSLLFLFCKKNKIPYIIVSHGGLSKVAFKKGIIKKYIFKMLFLNSFIKKSAALCFTSIEEQRHSAYIGKKYIIVPNPIEISDYPFRLESNNKVVKIIFLSKIDFYYKGLDKLFEALQVIKEDLVKENVSLFFYGYGKRKEIDIINIDKEEKDVLKLISNIKKLNLDTRVKYMGPVFGDEKMEILKNSDIYMLTSRSEAMPLSITEALSVGTPCLVTHGTNMTSLIKQYRAGWTSSLDKRELSMTILTAIKEYKINSFLFRKAARTLYEYNKSIDIGKTSILQYKSILPIE